MGYDYIALKLEENFSAEQSYLIYIEIKIEKAMYLFLKINEIDELTRIS
jgi:hypothetical protein